MSRNSISRGLLAGLVGGLAASWLMNQFQSLASNVFEGSNKGHGAQSTQEGSPKHGAGAELRRLGLDDPDDNAAERTANVIAAKLFDHEMSKDEKKLNGQIVHYVFGAATGALYGAASEVIPATTAGVGIPFGAVVWLLADEVVVPALGLSQPLNAYPISKHAFALTSHLVYGLATDAFRRVARLAV